LDALFRTAIRAGKRARRETAISSNPASISSVAIALAQEIVGDLRTKRVLIVGAGTMAELALDALRKRGVTRVAVANRSRTHAEELAAGLSGPVYGLDELPAALVRADVVISAARAPGPLITAPMVAAVRPFARRLVLVDIAVPRNVEAAVRDLPDVHLFNVDDLREGLDAALEARQNAVPEVETIIAEELAALDQELRQLAVRPLIADLRQRAEAIRQQELARTLRFLGEELDPQTLKHVEHLSRSLVNKLLHEPTLRLREIATNGETDHYETTVRDLFALDPSEG
jgi:glutamyl-tRNA reductase